MKLNLNLKNKIYKIIFVKNKSLIQVENDNISQKKIQKDIKLLMNFIQNKNPKIVLYIFVKVFN